MADPAIQTSPAVKPVSQLDTAADLSQKYDSLKRGRELRTRQWQLNLAFYKGRQYTFYSKTMKRLQTLPTDDGDKPRYRVRIVSNQIVPGCQSLLSKLLKTKPRMQATPGSGSDQDLRAAEMAETLLEYWWQDHQLDDALEEAMLWSLIGGQGYWKIWWDDSAGKAMTFMVNPNDGSPIMDDNLKTVFTQMLQQQGVDPAESMKTVYMGDICVETVSPFDIYPDPTVKRFNDAKFVIQRVFMDPDEIKIRYKRDVKPDAVPGSEDAGVPNGTTDRTNDRTTKELYVGYFKPTASIPRGRIVTWAGKEIYEDKDWDLPTNDLPFVKFHGVRVPGEVYDDALVTHALPLQKELNRTLSQMIEFKNLTVKPQWMAPAGSLRTRRTDEPGAIFEYNPIGNAKPEPIPVENIPQSMFEHLQDIQGRIDTLFSNTEIMQGNVPPNVEAGIAIDLLQEMATDRLAPTIRLLEMSLEQAGHLMLTLGQQYYTEPRLIKIRGSAGTTQVKQFTQADIKGSVQISVETGSGLPRTRAGRQARIESFIDRGVIQPEQAWRYLDMADLHGISDQFMQDEDQAYREHERLDELQPISILAMQDAQTQCQQLEQQGPQAVNPQSGQPFQSPQELQAFCQQQIQAAMTQGSFFDNHSVHLDVHARVIKGFAFQQLPVEVQKAYTDHMSWHQQTLFSMPVRPEPQSAKVSLQLRGAVTPDEASAILQKSGVDINPEQAAEPPTETWVSTQIPPGYDPSGAAEQNADPHMEALLQSTIDMNEGDAKASVAHAGAQADVITKQAQANLNAQQTAQQMDHAQQKHEQAMAHAQQKHEAAMKAAANPPSKGKE